MGAKPRPDPPAPGRRGALGSLTALGGHRDGGAPMVPVGGPAAAGARRLQRVPSAPGSPVRSCSTQQRVTPPRPRRSLAAPGAPAPAPGAGTPVSAIFGTGAMGAGGALGAAGAVLVALVALGAPPGHGEELSGIFQEAFKHECQFLNGTERVRLVVRYIHNREQIVHFDSDVGHFVGDTPWGERVAKYFNSQEGLLERERADVDTVCRHNYGVFTPFSVDRRVPPQVEVFPVQSSSAPQTNRLACAVSDFYPAPIEVRWFKNGREELERVVATDVIQNGDWTYQVLVMLETTPQRGDTYACQVEHVSLQQPRVVHWELSDGSNSKMLTGIGGFVLGLIFIVVGLIFYMRKKGTHFPVLQASS